MKGANNTGIERRLLSNLSGLHHLVVEVDVVAGVMAFTRNTILSLCGSRRFNCNVLMPSMS